ncbi:MAG TPA: SIS domain-containing protein [Prolixibacteraceae bacterium]|nr:SIS domain-containing protein [Prolixibacteraceae bacterium]
MNITEAYLEKCIGIIETVKSQQDQIRQAAKLFAETILSGRMVHVFGSGHSRIMVEEMWPRYGSFPGFNPIVELSLTFHNLVVGANGQRQAMFLENVSGFADRILRNFDLKEIDTALIISSSGCNVVPIEMAEIFQRNKIKVVSIISVKHSEKSFSKRSDGKKLGDFSDLILDTGAPAGDAMIYVPGLDTPVAPGSTVGGIMLINCIKAELAALLTDAGQAPNVLSSAIVVGEERAVSLFEGAYDEHAHRLAKLFEKVGIPEIKNDDNL